MIALRLKGMGPLVFQRHLEVCGSLEGVLHRQNIFDKTLLDAVKEERREADRHGVKILSFFDEAYPSALKNIADPPLVLYMKGELDPNRAAIGIVGARKASDYGLRTARRFSRDLAAAGITVVSGMALGIDAAAHEGALEAGSTLAVLGSGLAEIYPSSHQSLARRIAEKGALLSEYPMREKARPQYFPIRNRLISGLSRGVLVVEAAEKSGSLITADSALEQGREVYAVPGNVDSSFSSGTNRLLRQGAKPVLDAGDILEDFGIYAEPVKKNFTLGPEERALFDTLSLEPLHVDTLVEKTRLGVPQALSALFQMEMKGVVKQLPGKRFLKT